MTNVTLSTPPIKIPLNWSITMLSLGFLLGGFKFWSRPADLFSISMRRVNVPIYSGILDEVIVILPLHNASSKPLLDTRSARLPSDIMRPTVLFHPRSYLHPQNLPFLLGPSVRRLINLLGHSWRSYSPPAHGSIASDRGKRARDIEAPSVRLNVPYLLLRGSFTLILESDK